MTLNEAYEKLRREAISLRRENEKLKQGNYVDADRLAHEKEIRHLTWELANEYSCAMKSQFRQNGNHVSGTGNHQVTTASLLADVFV